MSFFTANDAIFDRLKKAEGLDPVALQNLVNALNKNSYANAVLTTAAQRGDVVFELVDHEVLKNDGAGARFSNDRGTDAFGARQNKFAIQLDKDWFVPHSTVQGVVPATFAQPQAVNSALGMVVHEGDHSNRQSLYDDAYRLNTTSPNDYRPDLTGAARVAAAVDLTMKAEVAGWYADLNTLRAEAATGHVSAGQYNAYTREGTINAKLIAVEAQGKAMGLTGDALLGYVSDHGKQAIPASYPTRYTDAYAAPGVDKVEVRKLLAYALDGPGQVKDFAEEVAPDGTYVSTTTYNNGERITTVYDGYRGNHSEAKETLQADGTYRLWERGVVSSYNGDGSFGDRTTTEYYASGQICRITDTDGAGDSDYATRTSSFDGLGRQDWTDVALDDGGRRWYDFDQDGSQGWERVESKFDAWGREDYATMFTDDGGRNWFDYDQNNERGNSLWQNRVDAQGREDWRIETMDDGARHWTDFDQTGERGDSIWQNRVDAQGREDWRIITMDDGGRTWMDYDQTGERGDSLWTNHVDAWGREDWANIFLDDGSRDWYDYDQDGSQGWSKVISKFDAWGREDFANMYFDDGQRDQYDYDQDGSQGWSTVISRFDAWGREDYATVYADGGGRTWYDYDQANQRGDRIWSNHVDAWGREDWANITMDDGSRNTYDYDQDGSQSWSRIESRFGANGRAEFATSFFDDGSRVVVDHDYYKFGEHQVVRYDQSGRGHLVGSMMDGYPGLVFRASGGVTAFDGTVLAAAQAPSSPVPWTPLDTGGAICGTITTPWGTYIDCS